MAFFSSKKTAAETPIPEVMEEHMPHATKKSATMTPNSS